MTESPEELVMRLHREAIERLRGKPLPPPEPIAIDLPEEPSDPAIVTEWRMFRQAVAGLLAGGGRGRYALVKAGHPITVWDTLGDAARAGQLLYGSSPCLVQEIQPTLRPLRVGYHRACRE